MQTYHQSLSLSPLVSVGAGVSTEVHPPSDDLLEPHFEVLDIVGKEEREGGIGGEDREVGRNKDRNKTTGVCVCVCLVLPPT